MAIRHNLQRRGGRYYYRGSFTLNGKEVSIRLALNTSDRLIARERAARLDTQLKTRWRLIVNEPDDGLTEKDKASILRAAAVDMRGELERLHLRDQVEEYDDEDEAQLDYLKTLRALELIARDLYAHGVGPSFGTHAHFEQRFLGDRPGYIEGDQLERVREILEHAPALRKAMLEGPVHSLVSRNIPVTDMNVVLARRQALLGILAAVRDAEGRAMSPASELDDLLASIAMPECTAGDLPAASHGSPPMPTLSGETHDGLPLPTVSQPATSGTIRSRIGDLSIADAAKAFLDASPKLDLGEAASRWTAKTRSQFDAVIFLAGKYFHETAIRTVEEDDMAGFFRALRRLPRNHHKTPSHAGMSLQEIGAANDGAGLSLATTNRHMRFLRMVFDWAGKRIDDAPAIDWSQFVEADRRMKRDKRPAFTEAELTTLFQGAIWSGSESRVRRLSPGRHIWHDSAYWLPLMLTYTGCRREEIAKAMVTDIQQMEGIWVIKVRDTETGRIKTISSERDLPIADELIRLGLLGFVERQREAGQTLLFPELAGGSSYGDVFYKKWWRAFMRAGLVPEGKDIHSIRHFVSTSLAAANVSEERRADLLGHTIVSSETGQTYTKVTPLPILREVVNTIPRVTMHLAPHTPE